MGFRSAVVLPALAGSLVVPSLAAEPWRPPAPVELPSRVTPYPLASGRHRTQATAQSPEKVFTKVIHVDGADWMWVELAGYDLGTRGRLSVKSVASGEQQVFDASMLEQWGGRSGIFAGPDLELTLYAGPGDREVFFEVARVVSGEVQPAAGAEGKPAARQAFSTDCPTINDNRRASTAPASGRIIISRNGATNVCTGWITANGSFLTAAHCADQANAMNMVSIQFNPPGQPAVITSSVAVPAANQFAISNGATACGNAVSVGANVVCQFNATAGQNYVTDWAIFKAGTNTSGQTPFQVQQAFYRLSLNASNPGSATAATIGYGIDTDYPDYSFTEQMGSGAYSGLFTSGSFQNLRYVICSPGGTSGAPVVVTPGGATFTLGVHDGSGSDGVTSHVQGTSFTQSDLQAQVIAYPGRAFAPAIPGANVVNVDAGSVSTSPATGSVFTPYVTIRAGLQAAGAMGGASLLTIVGGSYPESGMSLTIAPTNTIYVALPVGNVTVF